jgi:hypothetical protein
VIKRYTEDQVSLPQEFTVLDLVVEKIKELIRHVRYVKKSILELRIPAVDPVRIKTGL